MCRGIDPSPVSVNRGDMESPKAVSAENANDIWEEDDYDDLGTASLSRIPDSEMQREWETRKSQFQTLGYRDGISAGKESSVQGGFNLGFKEAVVAGFAWGVARGATSAYAGLPVRVQELLLKDEAARKRLETLTVAISDISSTDAMRMYYEDTVLMRSTGAEGSAQGSSTDENAHTLAQPPIGVMEETLNESGDPSKACCGREGGCGLQGLTLEPVSDDVSTISGCILVSSPGPSATVDNKSPIDGNTSHPGLHPGDGRSSIKDTEAPGSYNRLEKFQSKVQLELMPSILKLSGFPISQ